MGFPVSFIIFIHQLSLGFSEKTHATACLLNRRNLTVTSLISSSGFPADLHFSTATRELLGFALKYIIRITRKILKLSSYHVKHSHTKNLRIIKNSLTVTGCNMWGFVPRRIGCVMSHDSCVSQLVHLCSYSCASLLCGKASECFILPLIAQNPSNQSFYSRRLHGFYAQNCVFEGTGCLVSLSCGFEVHSQAIFLCQYSSVALPCWSYLGS